MNKPSPLRPGDRIAVVAPASNCSREEFDRGVREIARLGYEPVFSEAVFERDVFSAGSAATRAADFMRAWSDPTIAALIAVRGGYGSVQLLPLIGSADLAGTPKLFIGYSDTTSILSWLTCHRGVPALHGPMLEGRLARGPEGYDEASFLALLKGGHGLELAPDGLSVLKGGEAAGPLHGGTLTQLVASFGTPYAFDPPAGCVLFIEDANERPYRIHRMLVQMQLAGMFARARALVFGEMRGCDEPGGVVNARRAVEDATAGFPGPIVYGFPSGHTAGPCWTLPLGVRVRMVTAPGPAIIVEDAPVA